MKFRTFEADAKSWIGIVVFLVEFLHGYELCISIFQVLRREQCSEVDCSKEAAYLENDLKAMKNDLGFSKDLRN